VDEVRRREKTSQDTGAFMKETNEWGIKWGKGTLKRHAFEITCMLWSHESRGNFCHYSTSTLDFSWESRHRVLKASQQFFIQSNCRDNS
jgi:hypothetical protein